VKLSKTKVCIVILDLKINLNKMSYSKNRHTLEHSIVLEKLKIEIDNISRRKCICANDFLQLDQMQKQIKYYSMLLRLAKAHIDINPSTLIYHLTLIEYCHEIYYLLGLSYTHMCATQYLKPLGYTSQQIDAFINYNILKYHIVNAKN